MTEALPQIMFQHHRTIGMLALDAVEENISANIRLPHVVERNRHQRRVGRKISMVLKLVHIGDVIRAYFIDRNLLDDFKTAA